ncbi:hypothetical protein [Sphingosinicella sp. BN140058]|uniref:hypothetical protein n=1 Tax=Sphingosinicella sp. BN140058 TaxID=1892855 RepID=UPI0010110B20|nr:hypothetical protein [Sphingosinicella sp. BN140058]QAY77576.1 hypothetical protein ETR14_14455 [Sphingosinicella sp. BN140058]
MKPLKVLRSPRYPVISLPEAIDRVAKVYAADHRNKIPKALVAEHMGYQGLNGKSLGIISAIAKYGLLEGGVNSMWVTPLAVDILERESSDPERLQALRTAAGNVELYNDIDEQFSGKVSDQAIRSYLITKRSFLPESAERLIRSYRETKELVEGLPREGEPSFNEPEPGTMAPDTSAPVLSANLHPDWSKVTVVPPEAVFGAGQRRAVFDLSEGEVVITYPADLSPESVSDLQDYLAVFMKKARREAGIR